MNKWPDEPCIGVDGRPATLTQQQLVFRGWCETVTVKGKKVQVWREQGYVVAREVPA